ncbi:MAG TPA: type 4a pilus biogenesis protein PilO [Gaiellaceae bacterium]|nr:type 4a pilus biogenesis protein PilO [Gaiellaceae bacterium]
MTARLESLPKAAQVALMAALLLLVALMGYFTLIAPKRSTAADLKKQSAAVQAEIDKNRSSAFQHTLPAVRSANVFALTQAMPNTLDTPDVLITLSQLAKASGISFDEISTQGAGTGSSTISAAVGTATVATSDPFATQPIQAKFTGSYYDLLAFLQRVRNLVRVENGRLFTAGRLFDVSAVSLAEGPTTWPQVTATLTINEFVPQTVAPATPAAGSTGTTSTTTTATTTTSNSTSAAPSTSGGTS